MKISQFKHNNRIYHLSNPIEAKPRRLHTRDRLSECVYCIEEFSLWGRGDNKNSVLLDLSASFDYAYRAFVDNDDKDELDAKAEDMRKRLSALVERVEELVPDAKI